MGQMAHALMIGAAAPKMPKGKMWYGDAKQVGENWVYEHGLFDEYKPGRGGMRPSFDEDGRTLGFFVAVGGSGESGVPYLEGPIDIMLAEQSTRYKRSCARARREWARFSTFCAAHGVALPEARLYLVQTETA
jgi:hypothetical protein